MKQKERIRVYIATQLHIFLLIHFVIPGSVNSEEIKDIHLFREDDDFVKSYERSSASFSMLIPTADYPTDKSLVVSKKCVEDSRLIVRALLNQEEWALSSKILIFKLT